MSTTTTTEQTETALATRGDAELSKYTVIEVLLGSTAGGVRLHPAPYEQGKAFLSVFEDVAWEELETETDENSPWYVEKDDTEEKKKAKGYLMEKAVETRALEHLEDAEEAISDAIMQHKMAMARNLGWVGPNGEYISASEFFGNMRRERDPDAPRSGREIQIDHFVSETANKLVDKYDVPIEDLTRLNRPNKRSILAEVDAWVGKVEQIAVDRDDDRVTEDDLGNEMSWIIKTAEQESISGFVERAKARYRPPDVKPPKIRYDYQAHGDHVRVVAEMDQEAYRDLFYPRLSDVLDRQEGMTVPGLSLAMVHSAIESGDWSPVRRAILFSHLETATVYGILEANRGEWIDLDWIWTATEGTHIHLQENEVLDIMAELSHFGIVEPASGTGKRAWRITDE